jgi:hypothetical protein
MYSANIVFSNKYLRKYILKFNESIKCKHCNYKIKSGDICISCVWHVNNPNLLYILRTSR